MSERLRFNTAQAAEYANCHTATILKAAEAGELHGGQRIRKDTAGKPVTKGGRWSFRRECIDAWLDGSSCEHEERRAS